MRNRVVWLAVIFLIGLFGISTSHAQDVENLLVNGGFEDGTMASWGIWGDQSGEVVDTLVDAAIPEDPIEGSYCLHVTTNTPGPDNNWDYGFNNAGHVFETGKKYTLSVWLKCKEGELQIRLKPERGADPWEGYGDQVITMTEEWVEYSVTTSVFTENVDPGSITFHSAFAAGEFWVDGARWYEGDYVEPSFSSFTAREPNPEDGAIHLDTWASLSWKSGNKAASHDVYFGENFDDVEAGTEDTFQGNQGLGFFVVGFPGYPYPDGLVQGTTYYWRIDEVNDLHPDSPWVGDVWSFWLGCRFRYETAYCLLRR